MELPNLGKSCSIATCHAYDFLPYTCPHCKNAYCPDHRHFAAHACSASPDKTITEADVHNQNGEQRKVNCGEETCPIMEIPELLSLCSGCQKKFCLKHRHLAHHACSSITAEQKAKEDRKKEIKEFVDSKMGSSGATSASSTKGAGATTATVAAKPKKLNMQIEIMKMKSKAKGDQGVPMESRIYLRVRFPTESGNLVDPHFFHKDWTIGRTLDHLAKTRNVPNRNNASSSNPADILHLYTEEGERLDPAKTLTEAGVVSGSGVVLERGEFVQA